LRDRHRHVRSLRILEFSATRLRRFGVIVRDGNAIQARYTIAPTQNVLALVLWDTWRRGGIVLRSGTIVTRPPNGLLASIRSGMPVVLYDDAVSPTPIPSHHAPAMSATAHRQLIEPLGPAA